MPPAMSLKEQTVLLLKENNIDLNPSYGQHFLVDDVMIDSVISLADISKTDAVLEIGPGTGNITRVLAGMASKVIAVEIDERFENILKNLPMNVEVVFESIKKYLKSNPGKQFNKIISNIPYDICESLMDYFCTAKQVDTIVLIVPSTFVEKVGSNPFYSAFLDIKPEGKIPKEAFYPVPDTSSVIMKITRRSPYEKDNDVTAFVLRKLYALRSKKLKNALKTAVIDIYSVMHHKKLPGKTAREKVSSIGIPDVVLDTLVEDIKPEILAGIQFGDIKWD
jgi:16S rRNA (adenine1518-N6/adenine1519-N6)-dimethyltransferase